MRPRHLSRTPEISSDSSDGDDDDDIPAQRPAKRRRTAPAQNPEDVVVDWSESDPAPTPSQSRRKAVVPASVVKKARRRNAAAQGAVVKRGLRSQLAAPEPSPRPGDAVDDAVHISSREPSSHLTESEGEYQMTGGRGPPGVDEEDGPVPSSSEEEVVVPRGRARGRPRGSKNKKKY